jgi:hypothetical protein
VSRDAKADARKAAETAAVLRRARQRMVDETMHRPAIDEYGPTGNAISEEDLLRGYRGLREPEKGVQDEGDR